LIGAVEKTNSFSRSKSNWRNVSVSNGFDGSKPESRMSVALRMPSAVRTTAPLTTDATSLSSPSGISAFAIVCCTSPTSVARFALFSRITLASGVRTFARKLWMTCAAGLFASRSPISGSFLPKTTPFSADWSVWSSRSRPSISTDGLLSSAKIGGGEKFEKSKSGSWNLKPLSLSPEPSRISTRLIATRRLWSRPVVQPGVMAPSGWPGVALPKSIGIRLSSVPT
jgi:hypothetical protein